MSTLNGSVCVVTGASSGIGEATARRLAERGAAVVVAARRADHLEALVERIGRAGGTAHAVVCDVRERSQVRAAVEAAVEGWGRLDVLVNNAGIMPLAPMEKCRMDDWDDMIDVNVKGLLYGIGYALPVMLGQGSGHVVNVSSVAGRRLFGGAAVYCGTKHAVHAISEGLRSELAERAQSDGNTIRVTVIAPGVVATELPDSITDEPTRTLSKQYYDGFRDPLTGNDVAEAVLYAVEAPPHVDVNEILMRPVAQVR
jgi:NADP-dependent 3-hydroxy acid dehydrogenase YdfG